MPCSAGTLYRNADGTVAPTIALALFALVAAGGVAFDYARLATMHTELQQAADQAALAAASQLDGGSGACARAAAAAANLLNNETYFASYGSGRTASVTNESACDATGVIKFYADYNQTTDTPGTAATDDATAKYVIVTLDGRQANYALTPIVGAFSSGTIAATAVATLGSGSICKIPPLMICNPAETTGPGAVLTFDPDTYKGRGLKLEAGGGGAWAPGNYGYLDFGNGAPTVEQAMGSNVDNNPCVDASTVATKPGNTASAPTGINVRFDMFENGLIAYCAASTGNCSPAVNVIKDVAHPQFHAGTPPDETAEASNPGADNCKYANGSDPWELAPSTSRYLPDPATNQQAGADPAIMGSPRDICHAVSTDGTCGGSGVHSRFGDGDWDRNLYFKVNYGTTGTGWQNLAWLTSWAAANGVTTAQLATISRYNVYRAEAAAITNNTLKKADNTDAKRRLAFSTTHGSNTVDMYGYANARCATPQAASATVKDRRVLTAAVVNCIAGNVQGSTHIAPIAWIDTFLVEPSINRDRTGADQIYVEIIGGATKPDGSGPFQYFLKQRPRLVK
jgi:Flp pilus assembly protein TadG